MHSNYLEPKVFETIVQNTPLVSIDLLIKHKEKFLLGKRINRPAKEEANIYSISKVYQAKFIGVFEHFYEDSIFHASTTHYVN